MPDTFCVKIVGPAGTGVMSIGETLLKAFVREGFYALGYPEYPSLIKGGHNTFQITLSANPFPINSPVIDILIPLTQQAQEIEKPNLTDSTHVVPILNEVATKAGNHLTLNTAALGYLACLLKIDSQKVLNEILSGLSDKPEEVQKQNQTAFTLACDLSKSNSDQITLPPRNNKSHQNVYSGNQAIGEGAISAGINLYTAYPMTPSTTLLTYLGHHPKHTTYLCKQAEDEIGAINTAIGASYTGAKSMVGTAGGGFALMQESISLAGMLETPLVVYVASRPGPATGLPTWTSQADLLFTVFSGHGEFPKIVLTPSDPLECYELTYQAFSLSQHFHIPVIILSDKYLSESLFTLPNFPQYSPVSVDSTNPKDTSQTLFPRYQDTPSGVSPRTIPGTENGIYICNSDEHNEYGIVDESLSNRQTQSNRRLKKLSSIKSLLKIPRINGNGENLLISWGSTKHIISQTAKETGSAHLHFNCVWPLPENLTQALSAYKQIFVIENNNTHQFSRLLRSETGLNFMTLGSDTGRPLNPLELTSLIVNHKS